jgi:hypothetical protein
MSRQTIDGQSIAQANNSNCTNQATSACTDLCDRTKNPNGELCAWCMKQHIDRCKGSN